MLTAANQSPNDPLQTLEMNNAQHYQIGAPSSPSIALGAPSPCELDDEGFVVMPSTFTYANEWTMGCTGFAPGSVEDRQV